MEIVKKIKHFGENPLELAGLLRITLYLSISILFLAAGALVIWFFQNY